MKSFSTIVPSIQKKISILIALVFIHVCGLAQTVAETVSAQPVQMADGLRSSGKIYVVVAVLLTVLLGLFLYLFRLDRKISKLEKR
jgi:CcmD family protein